MEAGLLMNLYTESQYHLHGLPDFGQIHFLPDDSFVKGIGHLGQQQTGAKNRVPSSIQVLANMRARSE
jgi:hypothetical protein